MDKACEICGGSGANLLRGAPDPPDGTGKWYHALCYAKSLEGVEYGDYLAKRPNRHRGRKPTKKRGQTL